MIDWHEATDRGFRLLTEQPHIPFQSHRADKSYPNSDFVVGRRRDVSGLSGEECLASETIGLSNDWV